MEPTFDKLYSRVCVCVCVCLESRIRWQNVDRRVGMNLDGGGGGGGTWYSGGSSTLVVY